MIDDLIDRKIDEKFDKIFSESLRWILIIVAILTIGVLIYNLGYINAINDNRLEYIKQAKIEFYKRYNNFMEEATKIVGIEVPQ